MKLESVFIMNKNHKKYFITLTGAKKNVGDFLITGRAIELLEHIAPEFEYVLRPHWQELNDIEFINKSEGIIILGGPGFQMNMYPGVYKLVENLKDIKVPIYTLGTGWKGVPGDRTTERLYEFTDSAQRMLNIMDNTPAGMSCRDYQTKRALNNNGYNNVTMTGCPVWYDIHSLGEKFTAPKEIKRVVYTPAQDETFSEQSIEVLDFLINKYKNAEIIVSFHRGIGVIDEFTPKSDAENTKKLADKAEKMGAKVVDVSYDRAKLDFYDDCDLHVGYRVHAHIYFLSKRMPSILLHEDGRGNGVSEALESPGVDAYKLSKLYSNIFSKFNKNRGVLSLYRKLAFKVNEDVTSDLEKIINNIERTDYQVFDKITEHIDKHYGVMEGFIKKITCKNMG